MSVERWRVSVDPHQSSIDANTAAIAQLSRKLDELTRRVDATLARDRADKQMTAMKVYGDNLRAQVVELVTLLGAASKTGNSQSFPGAVLRSKYTQVSAALGRVKSTGKGLPL